MESIESVKILKTLKTRSKKGAEPKVWLEGEVIEAPIPAELAREVVLGTGSVHVLNWGPEPKVKAKFFDLSSDMKLKTAELSTATTVKLQRERIIEKEASTRPKLVKRKKKVKS
jgi:hypothetical protein